MIENADFKTRRLQAVRQTYWDNTPDPVKEFWPLAEILKRKSGVADVSPEAVKTLFFKLPDSLFGLAFLWDFHDAAVRYEIEGFVERDLEKTVAMLQKTTPNEPSPSFKCWSCRRSLTHAQRLDADGNCPHCGVEIELA